MTANFLIAAALVMLGGVALAIQTPINGLLGSASGSGLFAASVSFAVGLAVLLVVMFATGSMPQAGSLERLPWWIWTGGAMGAFYVWAVLTNVHQLGALTMVALLMTGQLLAALVLDAVGFSNLQLHEISWQRILAVVLMSAGAVLSRW